MGLMGHDLFKLRDVFDRVLDLVLQPGRQRPIGQAQSLAHREDKVVGAQRVAIGPVTQMRQPLGATDDAVETVAMQHPEPLSRGGFVNGFVGDLDTAEQPARIIAGEFVMVARHEDHARAAIDLAQHFVDDVLLGGRPVPAALQLPAIDNVADQIERVAFVVDQEVGQGLGLAAARAQMGVGDEDGAVAGEARNVCPGLRWRRGTRRREVAQRILEPHHIRHRASPLPALCVRSS